MVVGIGPKPGRVKLGPACGNVGVDAFEAFGLAVRRRVVTRENGEAGIDLHPGDFRVRYARQKTKGSGACPAPGFKHMIPRLRGARGGKKDSVQSRPEPLLRLAQAHAAAQKSITGKVEMTGQAVAGILKWRRAMAGVQVDQMIAETGRRKDGYAFVPILGSDKDPPGESANRSFNRADMNVGDEHRDTCIVQQRVDVGQQHNIGRAKQLFHRTSLFKQGRHQGH